MSCNKLKLTSALEVRRQNWTFVIMQMFTSSTQLQNNSFHVVERTRRPVKCSKNQKCTCRACKTVVFHYQICKFVTFLLPSSRDEWIVYENIYSFVRRNSSGTSWLLAIMPNRPVRDKYDYPRKMERHFLIKPRQPIGIALATFCHFRIP